MDPTFSVITPTYNVVDEDKSDDFLLQISLLDKQTYPYIEHIVIDNASQDGTDELLKEYKNTGYISFFTEPDRGKFDAMNKGLMRAKGKYISFLSCDDFYHDVRAVEQVVTAMEEDKADFCCFTTNCITSDETAFTFIPSLANVFQVMPCPRQAFVFKKSIIQELGGFDNKFQLLADYDLILRIILKEYQGIMLEQNLLTYPLGQKVSKYTIQADAETNHIFYKNYRPLYPITQEELDRLVSVSEIPQPLLDKLALKFGQEDKDLFYERYSRMYQMRSEARKEQERLERQQRRGY